jgi:hypothetical protein
MEIDNKKQEKRATGSWSSICKWMQYSAVQQTQTRRRGAAQKGR